MNILVVDDDQLVNDFLAEALSRTGHNIDTCLSGEDALEELKKAYEGKDVAVITPALEKINEAWKVASEEMYKAQAEAQQAGASPNGEEAASAEAAEGSEGDNVEDVDFEEVK